MFFYASKVIGFFLQPSTLLILFFLLGFGLYWRGRRRAGIRVLAGTALIYAIAGLSPFSNAMMLDRKSTV